MEFSAPFTNAVPASFASIDTVGYTRADTAGLLPGQLGAAVIGGLPASYGVRAAELPTHGVASKWFLGAILSYVSGFIREAGVAVAGRRVQAYDRDTGELIGDAKSAADGSYSIPAMGRTKVRIIANDPTAFNSLAIDDVTPV
jgi:hypothetical protein